MDCFSCCISLLSIFVASEQEKQLSLAIRVSIEAHRFQNDGVKKGWEGRGIRFVWMRMRMSLFECCCHKQCVERVCIVVVA